MPTTASVSRSHNHRHALVTLALLACLSGCGPAPSGEASSIGTSMGGLSESQTVLQNNPSTHNEPRTSVGTPAPAEPREAEPLVVPDWMAQALASPDAQVRLTALDRWAQQGPQAPLDPLVVALDDEDEQVRAKAMALFEQAWAAEQKAKAEAEK